jgi:hypothetical protein
MGGKTRPKAKKPDDTRQEHDIVVKNFKYGEISLGVGANIG